MCSYPVCDRCINVTVQRVPGQAAIVQQAVTRRTLSPVTGQDALADSGFRGRFTSLGHFSLIQDIL